MKKLKKFISDDPQFALTTAVIVATTVAALMTGSAKLIEATAYAHRASKMK